MTSAQNDYIVLTDPSGGLLQNLNFMQYTNLSISTTSPPLVYQPNPFPYIYETRDYYGNIVTDYIVTNIPQLSVRATQVPYLAINPATNTLFGSTTHGVIVGTNQTYYEYRENFAGEYNIYYDTTFAQYYQALTFDSVGNVYISASSQMLTWFSNLYNGSAASILLKTNPKSNICIEIGWANYQLLDTTWVQADIRGLVVDSLNNLFCVDRMNSVVYKINLDDVDAGTPINNIVYVDWEIYADIAFGINGPMDITIDKFDNIYVLSTLTNNIVKITSDKIVTIIGKGLPSNPSQIAYNPADGLLYIACMGTGTLPTYIYKSSTLSGSNSVQYITSDRYVRGIACDNSGNIYYSTSNVFGTQIGDSGDIIIYKVQQTYTTSTYNNPNQNNTFWVNPISGPVGNLVYPINSIAINTSNNLYATNFNYVIFSRQFSETDNNVISTGNVWSVNPSNTTNYYNGSTSSITINPRAIAINNTNQMYVLDNISYSTTNILIYINASNTSTNVSLTNGNLLDSPAVMAFDSTGKLYIFNNISNTLCLVTFSAVTTASVTAISITGQPFSMVNSICVNFNNTYIYVSNNGNNIILQIQLSSGISTILSNSPLINKPTAVYQDPTTQIIYIANHNNAILYFSNNTMFELPIIAGTTSKTNANPYSGGPYTITKTKISLKCPSQIIMDTLNNLYIANSADQRDAVVKITPTISQTTLYNSLLNSLDSPADSAYSSQLKKAYIGNTVSPVITIFTETSNYVSMTITGTPLPSNPFSLTVGQDAVGNDILYCSLTNNTFYQVSSLGTAHVGAVMNITGALPPVVTPPSNSGGVYIRYLKQGTRRFLFVIDGRNNRILRIDLANNTSIVFLANANRPVYLTIDYSGTYLYTSNSDVNSGPLDRTIYRTTLPIDISLNTPIQTLFVTINTPRVPRDMQIFALAIDKYNYLFVGVSTVNGKLSRIYRIYTDPLGVVQLYLNWTVELTERFTSFNYNIDNNSIYITSNIFQECFLAFNMDITNKLGRYNDTLNILHTITTDSDALIFDFSFNVYNKYIVIDPSNIAPNVATNTTFNFVTPNVVPYPTDSYMLQCNGTNISDVFCNNCTYNKSKFIAGTYPTGLVYSNDTNYLYVALQNNTISRISLLGEVDNSYFPPQLGLVGPTSLVLDASFDMFVLNAGSDFISYITLRDNIISINNNFFTDIYLPICLTYDLETDLLYLLSGEVPNTRITEINARTGVGKILPIVFGTIYDPNGLTIDAFYGLFAPTNIAQPPNTKYLYVSNADQNKNYSILRVNLTSGLYQVTTLPCLTGLKYKPFTMTNQNDGFLYVANKNNDSLSKISITGLTLNVEPWAVDGISVPTDLAFDNLGHLFVADGGTSPRNSRISKIYTYDFFFTNVKLTNGTCPNTKIYDITTQSYVEIGYYASPNNYSFPIPIPYPIGT